MLAYVEQGDEPGISMPPFVMNKRVGRAIVEKYSKPGAVDAALNGLAIGTTCW